MVSLASKYHYNFNNFNVRLAKFGDLVGKSIKLTSFESNISCSTTFPNTEKRINAARSGGFLTKFYYNLHQI